MTKRFIVLWAFALMAASLMAGIVTQEEAMQQARQFLADRHVLGNRANLRLAPRQTTIQTAETQQTDAYYVFNCGNNEGYVIVSADDRTMSVLGYADEGTFDYSNMPDNMRHWLDDYAEQMRQLDLCGIQLDMAAMRVDAPKKTPVEPMILATWSQHEPYNDLCPTDPLTGNTCITGCVATAMAQLMYYYQYPTQTTNTIPSYTTTNSANIPVAGIDITPIDWANILPSYDNTDAISSEQIQAVALLMKLCGVSIKMNYSSTGSSSNLSNAGKSLVAYFDYDPSMHLESRNNYSSEKWEEMVYNELAAGRPLLYRGTRDVTGADSGHAFIVDGCDGNGYFHLNWGWGGSHNGYFLLSVLAPYATTEREQMLSNEGYAISQSAIFGLQPNTHGAVPPQPKRMTACGLAITGNDTLTRASANSNFEKFKMAVTTYNWTGGTVTFDLALGVFNDTGELVAGRGYENIELEPNYGYRALNYTLDFGKDQPDGEYKIMSLSCESGTDDLQIDHEAEKYAVYATLRNDSLFLRPTTLDLKGALSLEDTQPEASKLMKVTAKVHNLGTPFSGMIYLFSDSTRCGGRSVDIAADAVATVEMGYVSATEGTKTLSLAFQNSDNEYVTIATIDVDVMAPAKNLLEMKLIKHNGVRNNELSRYDIGSTLQLTINAKNLNTTVYDNKICAKLYKLLEDGSNTGRLAKQEDFYTTIEPGQEQEHEFMFTDLIDGATYFVWIYFYSEGDLDKEHRIYGGKYTVDLSSGIVTLENADETTDIYTIDGRKAGVITRSLQKAGSTGLRHGVYIIDGRKVVR